jgi:hypothetical protein
LEDLEMPKFSEPSNQPKWEPGVPTGPSAPPSQPNRPDLQPGLVVSQDDLKEMQKQAPQTPAKE